MFQFIIGLFLGANISLFLSYRKLQKLSDEMLFDTKFKKHILKIHIKNWKYMYIT